MCVNYTRRCDKMDIEKLLSMAYLGEEDYIYIGNPLIDSPFNICLAGITYPNKRYNMFTYDAVKHWIFVYVTEGKGYIETNEKILTVEAGDFYIIPAHCESHYYSDKENPYKTIWVSLAGSLVDQICYAYNIYDITVLKHDVLAYFQDFFKILKSEKIDLKKFHLKFHEMIIDVGTIKTNDSDSVLERIYNYIVENCDKKINLTELSEKFFISNTHLIRLFKNAYNKTPYDFYLEKKLEKSKTMLINTNLQIQEISRKLAFSDTHYYSRLFKKNYGISPQSYRDSSKTL